MRRTKICCFIVIIYLLLSQYQVAHGKTQSNTNEAIDDKFVLVVMNRVHYNDLLKSPKMKKLMNEGSLGLMNTRAPGRQSDPKSYLTIGAGTRGEADKKTAEFSQLKKEISEIYSRRTGLLKEEGAVNLEINNLISQNTRGDYGAIPGNLGETLSQNGLSTALLGSNILKDSNFNPAGFIAMDQKGYIAQSKIEDQFIQIDPASPMGFKTDYTKLYDAFQKSYEKNNFIVIETGDTWRLDEYAVNLTEELYQQHKNKMITELADFIEKIITTPPKSTPVMILSPYPSNVYSEQGDRLTPILYFGQENVAGLLTSNTTRRKGIVGNIDVAPTVLQHFNIDFKQMTGSPITSIKEINQVDYILGLNEKTVFVSTNRYNVLYSYATFHIIVAMLAILVILLNNNFLAKKITNKLRKYILDLLLISGLMPWAMLMIPMFRITSVALTYILIILLPLVVIYIANIVAKRDPLKLFITITGLVSLSILTDILLGQQLLKQSLLSYDPIIGARYYGLGNEYLGILIGSYLIFLCSIRERYRTSIKKITTLFFIALVLISAPIFGANVGGTITAAFIFMFTYLKLKNTDIKIKHIYFILLMIILTVGIIASIDLFLVDSKSHLARAISQVNDQGIEVMFQILTRKISMNLRLINVTVWSRVLLTAIVVLGILFYKPKGILKEMKRKYPDITVAWNSIILACILVFLVNDSGVVAAATTSIYLLVPLLYLVIYHLENEF
ncbi:hypothetical protein RH915_01245 [Serpentinicella sp. ANB-PHB4]|uniref:hypothetical protein n=1 Tax=Serpentinicella sp. ANB-PHB4 TaxID=3074076 RepID=UPI0028552041|nr:hypothetical protein [Serpentinicella sp. ANB-PHB4]MDR5658104.1 hypothetical protein [Serpentinicella sp. ANB-PHB4]